LYSGSLIIFPEDNMLSLVDLFKNTTVVILDSAMGTELQSRGADTSLPLWSARALIDNPDIVQQIHIDNIVAGADIITANTFRTQRRMFEKAEYKHNGLSFMDTARELTKTAVDLAKEAVKVANDNVLVAGSVSPLEDCYKPELVPDTDTLCTEHNEHIRNLIDAGVDLLLAETLNSVREISAVVNQIHQTGKEYCISFLCRNSKELYSGELLSDAVKIVDKFSPAAILINCIHPIQAEGIIRTLRGLTGIPLGVYANIGEIDQTTGGIFKKTVTVGEYYDFALSWKNLGVKIIGGCCGTNPDYVKKINNLKNSL
jgi:S-methylmethionine-dependent homocysteine/selenocysteine methylase